MARGRPKLSVEQLLARGTFEQRKQGDRLKEQDLVAVRPPMPDRPKLPYRPNVPIDYDDLIEANYDQEIPDAVGALTRDLTKRAAQKWVWNESDELAIANGCRFDLKRAMHFAYTLRNNLTLWEGRWAGEPFILRTWQVECLLRVFGWVRPDPELGWVRRFSKSAIWVPKKSGKSPTGASTAIYMWRYDGIWKGDDPNEPVVGGGQHVYCVAKNGKQARIVWEHARNMTHNSPVPKIEVDRGLITGSDAWTLMRYQPKLSKLTTITGDSKQALAAAEGLNACCIICDEAHVVDERTVEVTTDAGASQPQFLWFQISTFGSDPGYGKNDLELGRRVESGRAPDDGFFFRSYEAPQDSTDRQCGDPDVWRMANPNLGYTVSERQFGEAYERAKEDPSKFSGFKQRRLNIWQRTSNPMFRYQAWQDSHDSSITWDSIKGVGGGMGLDVASTEDWAALGLAWNTVEDGKSLLNIWCKMWTSEAWVEENAHRANFQLWQNDGHLVVHDGSAIDHDEMEADVLEALRWTRCQTLGYDRMFGTTIAQSLQKKLPRLAIYKFTQSVENYAVGTAELKNACNTHGSLRLTCNPALDWQAEHAQTKKVGQYEKPVKSEDEAKWKKIDAIQAIVMAADVKRLAVAAHKPYVGIV